MGMTPRERVEAVLKGQRPDRVPFTAYEAMVPRCETERGLRNHGLCIVALAPSVFRRISPHVNAEHVSYEEHEVSYLRTNIRTPSGDLHSLQRLSPVGHGAWTVDYLFKGPENYRALEFMIRDEEYLPCYEQFAMAQEMMGGDGFLLVDIGGPPLHHIMEEFMGVEAFAVEWAERRDEVLRLYDLLVESRRKTYRLVAESPALAANYGGNVSPEVVGLTQFHLYYLPHYDEFADIMHHHDKVVGVHFDANTWLISDAIARSKIDYVEAFTPRPDTDMSVAEARTAWPDKVLWANFPTSVHQQPDETIEGTARQILFEAASGDRFMLGITERVPPDRWQDSLSAISRVLDNSGPLPLR